MTTSVITDIKNLYKNKTMARGICSSARTLHSNPKQLSLLAATTLAISFLAIFVIPQQVSAYASPAGVNLSTAKDFIALSRAGIGNTGVSNFGGNVGASPITAASMTIPCAQLSEGGQIYGVDAAGTAGCSVIDNAKLNLALSDMDAARNDIHSRIPDQTAGAIGIGGATFTTGVYKWTGAVSMAGNITISGSETDIFIFNIVGAFAHSSGHMNLTGGAVAKNVFWRVDGDATIAAPSKFTGILMTTGKVGMASGASIDGRAYANTSISTISNSITIALDPAPQSTVTLAPQTVSYVASGDNFATLLGGGGSGSGTFTYDVTSAGTADCTVGLTTGVLTYTSAGTCGVTATKGADDNYLATSSTETTFTVNQANQAALTSSATTAGWNSSITVSATGGSTGGTKTYYASAGTATGCSIVSTTGVLTATSVGTCNVYTTMDGDANYALVTSDTITATFTKENQAAVTLSPQTVTYTPSGNNFMTLVAGGGSGSGSYTYAVTSAGAGCSVGSTTGVLSYTSAGTCGVTATRAADTNYFSESSTETTFTVNQAAQAAVTLSPQTVTYTPSGNNFATLLAGGGSGTGSFTYAVTSAGAGCSVNSTTGVLSYTSAGTCGVTATRAADADYATESSTETTFTVNQAAQAAVTLSPQTVTYTPSGNNFATLLAGGGSGTGSFTYAVTSAGAGCSVGVSSGVLSYTSAGTCGITATKAGDTNYISASSTETTFTVNQANQAALTSSATTAGWNSTITVSATGGTTAGTKTYYASAGTATGCSIDSSTGALTATSEGTCNVYTTMDGNTNYTLVTSDTITATFTKLVQAAVTLGSQTVTYTPSGDNFATLLAGGGSGTGSYTYAVTSAGAGCSVGSTTGVLSYTSAGTCGVTATREADATYLVASSTETTFTVNQAVQAAVTLGSQTVTYTPSGNNFTTLLAGGGSGTGSYTYAVTSAGTAGCSVGSTTGVLSYTSAGTCGVTATKAGDTNYTSASSTETTFTVNQANQAALTSSATTAGWNSTITVSATGGTTAGTKTYYASAGTATGCSIDSSTGALTATSEGTCNVYTTMDGNTNYTLVTSDTITATFTKQDQAAVTLGSQTVIYTPSGDNFATLLAGGGSGTGLYTYAVTSAGAGCSVGSTTGVLSYTSAGSCGITATKAGDTDYISESSTETTFTVNQANQAALTSSATTAGWDSTITVSATGGSTAGTKTYYASAGTATGCSIVSSTGALTATSDGTCDVYTTMDGNTNYTLVTSDTITATFTKLAQAAVTLAPQTVTYTPSGNNFATLLAGGGSGTGPYNYIVTSAGAGCSVGLSSGVLSYTSAGTCGVTVIRAGDANYTAASSTETTFTVNQAVQAAVTLGSQAVTYTASGDNFATLTAGGGSGTGSFTYVVTTAGTANCSVGSTTGVLSYTSAGTCGVTATKAGDTDYITESSIETTFTVNLPAQAAVTLGSQTVTYTPSGNNFATLTGGGGSGSGSFTYAVTSAGTADCTVGVTTGVLTYTSVGTCGVTATRAGDENYIATSSTETTFTVNQANQAALTSSATTAGWNSSITVTATGGSTAGTKTYYASAGTATGCSIDSSTGALTATSVGTCNVYTTMDGNANYTLVTSGTITATFTKQDQAAVTLGSQTVTYTPSGDNFATLLAAGGSGTGSYTYAVTSAGAGCSVGSTTGVLSYTSAGTCGVTATREGDANYIATSSTVTTFTVSQAAQAAVTLGSQTVIYTPSGDNFATLLAGGGSGTGLYTYAVTSAGAGCSVGSTTGVLSYTSAGTCGITATKAGGAGYSPESSTETTFTVNQANQAALTSSATTAGWNSTITVTATGGSTAGTKTYYASAGTATGCSIVSSTGALTATSVGTCNVYTTMDGNTNYTLVTSGTITATFTAKDQAAVTLGSQTVIYTPSGDNFATLLAAGGSGTGSYTYAVTSAGAGCSVGSTTGVLSYTSAGTCGVTATREGDIEYIARSSNVTTFTVNKAVQAAVTLGSQTVTYTPSGNNFATLTAGGGSGTGSYTYAVTSAGTAGCSVGVSSGVLSYTSAGTCGVTATKAGDAGYFSKSSTMTTFTVNQAPQAPQATQATQAAVTLAPQTVIYVSSGDNFLELLAGGGSGTGSYTYAVTSAGTAGCVVGLNSGVLSYTSAGTCGVTATKAGDAGYFSRSSTVTTFTTEEDVNLDDGDDTTPEEEQAGPNNGDGNNDGVQDNVQKNVTTKRNPILGAYTTTAATGSCDALRSVDFFLESGLGAGDNDYEYTLGLHAFESDCLAPGGTVNITHYWDKEYDTSNWRYRKYMQSTNSFIDFEDQVTYGTAVIGGKTVTTVSFSITDGGAYDGDGLRNGVIIDPAGPAVLSASAVETTEESQTNNLKFGLLIAPAALVLVVLAAAPKIARRKK